VTTAAIPAPCSIAAERLRAALRSATLLGGAAIVIFWIICALFGERLVPLDPYADNLLAALAPPSLAHWFGTDQLGRDIFSRVIIGSRDILTIAPLATLLGTVLGTILGLVIGYFGGIVDSVVGRILEALQALPLVIVALMALAAVGTSNLTVILVIGFVFTPLIARTVRSAV
jgi:peptide/nickel transport system permease protein